VDVGATKALGMGVTVLVSIGGGVAVIVNVGLNPIDENPASAKVLITTIHTISIAVQRGTILLSETPQCSLSPSSVLVQYSMCAPTQESSAATVARCERIIAITIAKGLRVVVMGSGCSRYSRRTGVVVIEWDKRICKQFSDKEGMPGNVRR